MGARFRFDRLPRGLDRARYRPGNANHPELRREAASGYRNGPLGFAAVECGTADRRDRSRRHPAPPAPLASVRHPHPAVPPPVAATPPPALALSGPAPAVVAPPSANVAPSAASVPAASVKTVPIQPEKPVRSLGRDEIETL